ncbi:hypothetical protein DJ013_20275 [Arcticibacterium luteifluviistationis]|uniref:Uncharacterized protein n=2 Tax=Arcticibacterium luteifluviistationis TaxID=1784714 RepID=A0A2Z4GG56_9BACT|nr:hypothetical protein DJ013_20275 [Arcticibacterium luteifluviistationis]
MDSKKANTDKGVQELDSLSQSIDSVFVEMEAERTSLKLKLEQSLKETNQDLLAVEQLLSVYSGDGKETELNKKKEKLEAKQKKLLKAFGDLSKSAKKDWQEHKDKLAMVEVLDE